MPKIRERKIQEIKKFYFENSYPRVNYMPCWLGKLSSLKFRAIYKIVCHLKDYPNLKGRGAYVIKQICKEEFSTKDAETRAFILDLLDDIRIHKTFTYGSKYEF